MRPFCGAHRGGRVYKNTRSLCPFYFAVPVHYAFRTFAGEQIGIGFSRRLYSPWLGRSARFYAGYVLQPSFGYIIGFALGAFVTGRIAEKKDRPGLGRLLAAGLAGLGVVYLLGMVHYYLISALYLNNPIGLWTLFLYCFILTVPGDILLCVLGAVLAKRLTYLGKINGSVKND